MRLGLPLAAAFAVLMGAVGGTSVAAQDAAGSLGPGVVNLGHLDFLHDSVPYPAGPPGHATTDPGSPIDTWWVYANFNPTTGAYTRTGGGAYDPGTNTYGQGAFDTDDVSRAAVAYLTHYRYYHDRHSLEMARGALRFVLYMQTISGPNAGNFVLWMQPGGALNLNPTPPDQPNPADSGASYWMARSIWAIGEGYATFRESDPGFASVLAARMRLAMTRLDAELLAPNFGHYYTLHGYRTPAWLIADGADASSEALLGLTAFTRATGDRQARDLGDELGTGIAGYHLGGGRDWPWGALMPWTRSVSDWHAWGAHMSMALAVAAGPLGKPGWLQAARLDASSFELHQQLSFGPINGLEPAPDDLSQIAYGDETTVDGLLAVGRATGSDAFQRWAGIAASWLFGDNPAGTPMYQPATGVVFDGINGDGTVNRNSGAESTIEGLLALMNAVHDPVARGYVSYGHVVAHTSYQKVEAEAGALSGAATVVKPASAWTGEALWSGGAYVDLGPGGRVDVPVQAANAGRHLLYLVFDKQQGAAAEVGVSVSVDGKPAGVDHQGGAGSQGDSPNPDYLWIDGLQLPSALSAGSHTITLSYAGSGAQHAKIDAVLLQPEVESKVLQDGSRQLALYKSLAGQPAPFQLPPGRSWRISVYDRDGEDVPEEENGHVRLQIPPYGSVIASSR
ncbi:MAG: hypothetical protein JF888_04170 [Candidatus Dormibacteraeota bacterium]|uniref:CBM6 domain-containing protein n=1 Tax=Candidatus Dormiibacter inghamiae TaxID=3127013 RepID=A0A934NBE8_9BACT|nr:hypothetical protein [Candidatus Dormibacteraeota bacterium]MBJ7604984.1 hypothetical protein [Candidatus Dormibacteraeota bacterium]